MDTKTLKSESFNRTVLSGTKTEEILLRLIRKEFDSIPKDEYWRDYESEELIKVAINLGFIDLAAKMTNDKA